MSDLHSLINAAQNQQNANPVAPVNNATIVETEHPQPKILRWIIIQAITLAPLGLMMLFFGNTVFTFSIQALVFAVFAVIASVVNIILTIVAILWVVWLINGGSNPSHTVQNIGIATYSAGKMIKQTIKQK